MYRFPSSLLTRHWQGACFASTLAASLLSVPSLAQKSGATAYTKATSTTTSAAKKGVTKTTPLEWEAGCDVPTLEECQAPGFLAGDLDDERGCGALQAEHDDWTCMTLFLASHAEYAKEVGTVSKDVVSSGVSTGIAIVPLTEEEREVDLEPDLMNLSSGAYARSLNAAEQLANVGGDGVDAWRDSGSRFLSCEEFAFESYYELNAFWHEINGKRHSYLETYEAAFSYYWNDYAIGTHRVNGQIRPRNDGYKNIEGATVLPSRRTVYRNGFFDLPKLPAFGSTVTDGPVFAGATSAANLTVALAAYTPFGEEVVEKVLTNGTQGQKLIAHYKTYFEEMSVEGKPTINQEAGVVLPPDDDDDDDAAPVFVLNVPSDDDDDDDPPLSGTGIDTETAELTGMIDLGFSGNKAMRRLFLAEFDELYDLQLEKEALVREWDRLNQKYAPGWTIEDLLDELNPEIDSFVTRNTDDTRSLEGSATLSNSQQGGGGYHAGMGYTTDATDDGAAPTATFGTDQQDDPAGPVLSEENAARKAVLDALLAIYTVADTEGCLDEGLTYCEFSLKEFSQRQIGHADTQTQAAYEACLEYLPSPFFSNLGETRWFSNPAEDLEGLDPISPALELAHAALMDRACAHNIPRKINAAGLRALVEKTATCQAARPAYEAALNQYITDYDEEQALQAAKARLALVPEIFDAATGTYRRPGMGSAYDNYIGGKYFGLGMDYQYLFDTTMPDDLCDFTMVAGGDFNAYAKVLGQQHDLVDVGAWVRTEEGEIEVYADVLGNSIFVGGDLEDTSTADAAGFRVNFVDKNRSTTLAELNSTFVIGPVPLTLTVGASGELGYETEFEGGFDFVNGENNDNNCPEAFATATLEPYMGVKGFIELAINMGVAKAGVRGEITIIRLSIPVDVDASTAFTLEDGPDINFDVDMSASTRFTTLAGEVGVFLELGRCPMLCKRFKKTIVKWDGITWEKELFHQTYNVGVADLILVGAQ